MNCPDTSENARYTTTIATEKGIYHFVTFLHAGTRKAKAKIKCNGVSHKALQLGNTNE